MLNIPLWNRVLIWGLVALGLAFAMPNLFYPRVERHNDAAAAIEAGTATEEEVADDLSGWPGFLPSSLVNLGLDLRGGAHLLAEVQVEDVYATRIDGLAGCARCPARSARYGRHDPAAGLACG